MDMSTFDLSEDAAEFLRAGRQLEYDHASIEAGEVKLKRFDELVLGEVWIGTDMSGDPHAKERGYYAIPAVSLTGECASYDPDFILLWLPREKLFGAWDSDHWVLTVFRGVSWADIVASPATYINAQWDTQRQVGEQFRPWPEYQFKSGRPF
jgi:hypothetical protein